jgi:SAM-dependent methyltransferase
LSHDDPTPQDDYRELLNLTITRPLAPPRHGSRVSEANYNLHGTTVHTRPILGTIGDRQLLSKSWALPLRDQSCESIDCFDVLEYVRDDEAMIDEFARVLRPGGLLRLRVPNTGPLAGLDGLNLYRYLSDITHRGRKPIETDEVGWRRHYGTQELTELLGSRFTVRTMVTQRVGICELADTVCLALFRWYRRSDARYSTARGLVRRIEKVEDRIKVGQSGTVLVVEAVRR